MSDKMMREALATAIGHIEHMAAWITNANGDYHAGVYSLESIGEDMPNLRGALTEHLRPGTAGPATLDDVDVDDSDVPLVAHAIAKLAMGREWDDILSLNAHDVDQGDLIDFARAAIASLRAKRPAAAASPSVIVLANIRRNLASMLPVIDAALETAQPASPAAGREEIARTLWNCRHFYEASDDQLHRSVNGRQCLVEADAILALGPSLSPHKLGAAPPHPVEMSNAAIADGLDEYRREWPSLEAPTADLLNCAAQRLRATPPAPGAADRERNLRRLVIAARTVCFDNQGPDAIRALDKASEAFSELVAWENDPNDESVPANTGETGR